MWAFPEPGPGQHPPVLLWGLGLKDPGSHPLSKRQNRLWCRDVGLAKAAGKCPDPPGSIAMEGSMPLSPGCPFIDNCRDRDPALEGCPWNARAGRTQPPAEAPKPPPPPCLASPLSCASGICHLCLGLVECLLIPSLLCKVGCSHSPHGMGQVGECTWHLTVLGLWEQRCPVFPGAARML